MLTTGCLLLKNLWNTCHLKRIKYHLHWIKHRNIGIHTTSSLWAFLKLSMQQESAGDTLELCMRIFNKIGAEIHPYDVAHRVPSRNTSDGRPKPIICKFTRRIALESVMAARREVNRIVPADIGLRESSSLEHAAIYDHLSP